MVAHVSYTDAGIHIDFHPVVDDAGILGDLEARARDRMRVESDRCSLEACRARLGCLSCAG